MLESRRVVVLLAIITMNLTGGYISDTVLARKSENALSRV
jgi:hypothetical protein